MSAEWLVITYTLYIMVSWTVIHLIAVSYDSAM